MPTTIKTAASNTSGNQSKTASVTKKPSAVRRRQQTQTSSLSSPQRQFLAYPAAAGPDLDDGDGIPPIEASAAKRWWRTRAIHYQNLAKLSCVSIETLQYQLERRESQLRELLAMADYYRIQSGTLLPNGEPIPGDLLADDIDRRMAKYLADHSVAESHQTAGMPAQSIDQLRASFWRRKCMELRQELQHTNRQPNSGVGDDDNNATKPANNRNGANGRNSSSSSSNKVPQTDDDLLVSRYIVHTLNQTNLLLNYPGNRGTASHRLNFIVDSIDNQDFMGKEDANYWKSKYISADMELHESHEQIRQLQNQFGELLSSVDRLGSDKVQLESKLMEREKEISRLEIRLKEYQNHGLGEIIDEKSEEITALKAERCEMLSKFEEDFQRLNQCHRKEVAELNHRLDKLSNTLNINLLISLDRLHAANHLQDPDERGYMINSPDLTAVENELWHKTVPGNLRNFSIAPPRMLTILSEDEHIELLLNKVQRLNEQAVGGQVPGGKIKLQNIQSILGHLEELISMFQRSDKLCQESRRFVRRQAPHLLRLYHVLVTIIAIILSDLLPTHKIKSSK
jgi:hypothetical protein